MRENTRKGCLWAVTILILIFPVFFLLELEDYYRSLLPSGGGSTHSKPHNIEVDVARWRLQLTGMVEKPASLTLDEIKALPAQTFQSPRLGHSFKGVSFSVIVEKCKPRARTEIVFMRNARGAFHRFDFSELLRDGAALIYEIDGKPLSVEQGKPIKLFFAGNPDKSSVDQVVEIKFTRELVKTRKDAQQRGKIVAH